MGKNPYAVIVFVSSWAMVSSTGVGCSKQPVPPKEPYTMSYDKRHYPFALSDAELRALVENARKIQIGDSRQEVKTLLGEPWEDMAYGPKEMNKIAGRFVKYIVTKATSDIVNNHDQVVTFYFDTSDRLTKISSNVPGIPSRP